MSHILQFQSLNRIGLGAIETSAMAATLRDRKYCM
jgi:hypothetical protein